MSICVDFEAEEGQFEPADDEPEFEPPPRQNGRYSHRRQRTREPSDFAYNAAQRSGGEPEDHDQDPAYKVWNERALTQAGFSKVKEYPYRAPNERLLFYKDRYEHPWVPGEKKFILRRPAPDEVSSVGYFAHAGLVMVPYRWPELIAAVTANPDVEVNWCEGEKDADTLVGMGLVATSAATKKITMTIIRALEALNVKMLNIWEDNDEVGRHNALKIAQLFSGIVRSQKIVRIPGLARGKDVTDWFKADPSHTKEALLDIVAKMPEWGRIKIVNPAEWADKPIPAREFLVPPLLPAKNVTLLYGEGGNGKSLLSLDLTVARATGNKWLGLDTLPGRTLVFSAEDDQDELQRRLAAIALYYKVSIGDLSAIRLVDLVGQDAVIGELSRNGRIVATELYRFMIETIESFQPGLVIIDALADSFAGDENNRTQARQFISMLRKPAIEYGCAFLTLAHPSLSGIMSGRGTSGSTGWSNSVRARMYLETLELEGKETDPNLKMLRQPKANYAAGGFELALRYQNGVLIPVNAGAPLSRTAKELQVEEIFMTLLLRLYGEERFVNNKPGPSYAPAVFAMEPEATEPMVSKKALQAAMVRLFQKRRIKIVPYGPPSRGLTRFTEAPL